MLRARLSRAHTTSIPSLGRAASTTQTPAKKEGSIADAFVSLSGQDRPPLPDRFRELKQDLIRGRETHVVESWKRLLRGLREENDVVRRLGSNVIPQIDYRDLQRGIEVNKAEIQKRGVVVVRGVIPEDEARAYKDEIEEYVRKNPSTRAFPADNPQVFELYWSAPQLKARAHPSLVHVQRQLMAQLWHTASDPATPISTAHPLAYADRLRIRQPGDARFALGPHVDGGSVERWEPDGYGRVYADVFAGRWDSAYDPWDAGAGRVDAVTNKYDGLGPCSMFRMWQGWLSMSATAPGEGTLLVNPLLRLSTAYLLLRPFFRPLRHTGEGFLDEANWVLEGDQGAATSELHGATPGAGQELSEALHPHLELGDTMVHVPPIRPGDYVAWHCDTIHAVDKVHAGASDSSVLYIPVCPTTALNAAFLARQRAAFEAGTPGPDFPGGPGEAAHVGRPTEAAVRGHDGRAAMGLEKLSMPAVGGDGAGSGAREAVGQANAILGF